MIEFRNVTVAYGRNIVLNGLSFKAGFNEKIAILGRSGQGKTTILKLILGLIRPDSGAILIDGKDIAIAPRMHLKDLRHETQLREIRQKFSVVFQEGASSIRCP